MKTRFETTEEEDDQARDAIGEAFMDAYRAGRVRDPLAKPHADELWEALLKILGIGEWDD